MNIKIVSNVRDFIENIINMASHIFIRNIKLTKQETHIKYFKRKKIEFENLKLRTENGQLKNNIL